MRELRIKEILEDKVIGCLNLCVIYNFPFERIGIIDSLFIDDEYKEKGVESNLIKKAIKLTQEESIDKLMVEYDDNNQEEIDFYKKEGFNKSQVAMIYLNQNRNAITKN